ncbi:hypothetical protein ACHAQD_012239 [Fusarium lateritium]
MTGTATDVSINTNFAQVTLTKTQKVTDLPTQQVTRTVATTINVTSTQQITNFNTQVVTVNVPTTVTVTVTQVYANQIL